MAIEPQAAYLAAQFGNEADHQVIESALTRMKNAENGHDETLEADIEFHKSVLEASNNPFYCQLTHFIETALRVNIRFTNRHKAVTTAEYQAHVDIYQAIVNGDAQGAWDATMATQKATLLLTEQQIAKIHSAS